jgi:SAM-dependent methyltransferase
MFREIRWIVRRWWRGVRRGAKSWPQRVRLWQAFWRSFHAYRQLASHEGQPEWKYLRPCLEDACGETTIEPIYFYQDAWAFEWIVRRHPARHVDVGSHHKYVALLSKVLPVTMVDLRPLSARLDSLTFKSGSILNLPFADGSVPSVSSLCVIEHIGLGRYGEELDPHGTEKAVRELKRIVQPGGELYVSAPLHRENRVYFNAHRVFAEPTLFAMFAPFEILDRQYICGQSFGPARTEESAVGCYRLRRPL